MPGYLVERYWPDVSADKVREACQRVTATDGPTTTFLGVIVVPADETVFFEFAAVSGAAVTAACAAAGVRCDRLVAADYWGPQSRAAMRTASSPRLRTPSLR